MLELFEGEHTLTILLLWRERKGGVNGVVHSDRESRTSYTKRSSDVNTRAQFRYKVSGDCSSTIVLDSALCPPPPRNPPP
jgi:hypothetical protein